MSPFLDCRKAPSLSSTDVEEIFLFRLANIWQADVFRGPEIIIIIIIMVIVIGNSARNTNS